MQANDYEAVKILTTHYPEIVNYWYRDLTEPTLIGERLVASGSPFLLACQYGQVPVLVLL